MSLFQFKISSLTKQKDKKISDFFGKSVAPKTGGALGFKHAEEDVEDQASQFFIDENDLWNDDDERDVFEPHKTTKPKKTKGVSSPAKQPDEISFRTADESDDFSDCKFNDSANSKCEINDLCVSEDKPNEVAQSINYHKPGVSEVCFDLVEESDDDTILPESPVNRREASKSPTFMCKVRKKNSELKKDDFDVSSLEFESRSEGKRGSNVEVSQNCSEWNVEERDSPDFLAGKSLVEEKDEFEVSEKTVAEKASFERNEDVNSVSKEQGSTLGMGEATDLWLRDMLQNEAFSNISSETPEEKLQSNLSFLNKSYVEILERVASAFESLPMDFLSRFPEFDPNVFITMRTTRRRIKAIIIKTENMLKRKTPVEEKKSFVQSETVESPVTRDFSRLRYSSDFGNPFEDVSKPSDGVFSFKQPSKFRNSTMEEKQSNFVMMSPPVREKEGGQTKLNFPVSDTPKMTGVLKSSTPLASVVEKPNSDIIDLTDVLYSTPGKTGRDKPGLGKFHGSMRNDGATGEFDGMNFPHSRELLEKFRQKFGLRTFRPNQLQVINAALLGHDCFVLMPTGGGKSLCYQLPALVTKGVTVVVSPLRSLILDQVTKLLTLDIAAGHLSGELTESEAGVVYRKLNQPEPKIKLLYVTPEKVGASASLRNCLLGLYKRKMLARFVIDEAHCVSQWGHDFRPDYKKLRELRENYPDVKIMALTATATPRVRTDILHQLKVANPKWFLSSFNRSNLVYSVREKKGKSTVKEIAGLIQNQFKKDTGVIYCFSRKECEDVAKSLKDYGITAIPYHAGLNDNERTRAQNLWMNDKVKVVCATIAFGMGIDKLDVRFVIHFSLPKSIEGYYQESGRAGRDGEKATCILFYCYRDRIRMLKLINMEQTVSNQAARKVHVDNLFRVAAFAENKTDCRRALQLEYFGEKFDRRLCIENRDTACDNCLNQGVYESIDVTEESKAIVASVKQVCGTDDKRSSNFTMLHFVDVFKGTVLKKVLSEGHDSLPLYGLGKSWQRLDAERLFRKLIMEEFLKERLLVKEDGITFAYIKFGPRGEELLKGNIRIMFDVKKRKGSASAQAVVRTEDRVDPAVLEIQEKCYSDLMDAIHEIASSVNCNPNAIMNVQALRAMSNSLPETAEEMLSINHVTTANFEKYGAVLLEITKKYAEERKLLEVKEVPEDLFGEDPWSRKSEESPYFDTEITYVGGKGQQGGKKRKRSNNRKFQSTKKWKGGSGAGKASTSKSGGGKGRGKSGGNASGATTVPGAKFSALMELPTSKSRFDRPKVILKNL